MIDAPRNALLGKNVPSPDFASVSSEISFVTSAIEAGLLRSCHDISDGGLLLALFEMTTPSRGLGGTLGVTIDLTPVAPLLRSDTVLFSETGGFIIEVSPESVQDLSTMAAKYHVPLISLGHTSAEPRIQIQRKGKTLVSKSLADLFGPWSTALDAALTSK